MKSIKQFLEELSKIPTKQRRKYIKHFIGKDRQLIYDLLECYKERTEEELQNLWRQG